MRFFVVAAAVVGWCLLCAQEEASKKASAQWRETRIGLWPLIHYTIGERYRKFSLLWPLFEYERDYQKDTSLISLWPLAFRKAYEDRTHWGFLFLLRKPFVGLWGAETWPGHAEVWMLPLLSYKRDITDQKTSLNALMWLFSYQRTSYSTTTWLFPLFHYYHRFDEYPKTKITFFAWLAGYSRSEDEYSVWFLPFFHYNRWSYEKSRGWSAKLLFPLVWLDKEQSGYRKYERYAALPLLWYSRSTWGERERVRLFLFPVYYSKRPWDTTAITNRTLYRRNICIPLVFQWLYVPNRHIYIGVVPPFLFNYYHKFRIWSGSRAVKIYALMYLFQLGASDRVFILRLIPVLWHKSYSSGAGYTVVFPLFWHFKNGNVIGIVFPVFWYFYEDDKEYTVLVGLSGYGRHYNSHIIHLLFPISKVTWNTQTGAWSVTLVPYLAQVGVSREAVRVNIFPFFYQSYDIKKEPGAWGNFVLFPVFFYHWRPEWTRIVAVPFFGYSWSRDGGFWSAYILPPLFYIMRDYKNDSFKFSVLSVLAGYGYNREQTYRFGPLTVRGRRHYAYLAPLFWWERSPEETDFWLLAPPLRYYRYTNPTGATTTDFMWFLPYFRYYHDENEKVVHIFWELIRYRHDLVSGHKKFSILWYFLRWESDPVAQKAEFNFLYKLIWYRATPRVRRFHIFPLLFYTGSDRHPRYGRYRRFSVLGGLFGGGKKASRSFITLFFFDINF